MITAQTTLLHEMLTPNPTLWPDNLPHGYHSDDGHDYLDAALDIASQTFHIYSDLPYSLDFFLTWLDQLINTDILDNAYNNDNAYNEYSHFPNFACDAVTDEFLTLYLIRYAELTA